MNKKNDIITGLSTDTVHRFTM